MMQPRTTSLRSISKRLSDDQRTPRASRRRRRHIATDCCVRTYCLTVGSVQRGPRDSASLSVTHHETHGRRTLPQPEQRSKEEVAQAVAHVVRRSALIDPGGQGRTVASSLWADGGGTGRSLKVAVRQPATFAFNWSMRIPAHSIFEWHHHGDDLSPVCARCTPDMIARDVTFAPGASNELVAGPARHTEVGVEFEARHESLEVTVWKCDVSVDHDYDVGLQAQRLDSFVDRSHDWSASSRNQGSGNRTDVDPRASPQKALTRRRGWSQSIRSRR